MALVDDVVAYARTLGDRPPGEKLRYTMGPDRDDPLRTGATDCSGFVRHCYRHVAGIDPGTYTGTQWDSGVLVWGTSQSDLTAALNALQPGDGIFINHGWSNPTWDHIELYIGGGQTLGHGGPGAGPSYHQFIALWKGAYEIGARRWLTADAVRAEPPTPVKAPLPLWPLPPGHRFGDIAGPESVHGGWYEWEKPYVRSIQERLVDRGYAPGVNRTTWCDGIWEWPTTEATIRFQRDRMPGTQYWGQIWCDDYAVLSRL